MRWWLIRRSAPTINVEPHTFNFWIEGKQTPRIAGGDGLIFLSKEKAFEAFATVFSVSAKELLGDETLGRTYVTVSELKDFPRRVDLDSLIFSLTFVRNLERPQVHFQRGYRLLPAEDYKTILQGEPFIARTGYYELLKSLPEATRAAFTAGELLAGDVYIPFAKRLERLYLFIQERVLSVGEWLQRLESVSQQLEFVNVDAGDLIHVLADDEAEKRSRGDDIRAQAEYFQELRKVLSDPLGAEQPITAADAVQQIISELGGQERGYLEWRFERLFRGHP